jgi:anti-anti-sigma factor
MTIEVNRSGEVVIVKPVGRLDAASAPEFDQECQAHVKAGCKTMIADLSELTYVSSLGLRSFVSAGKELQARGGGLMVSGMKGMVKEVFTITQLISVFAVYDSVESALRSV